MKKKRLLVQFSGIILILMLTVLSLVGACAPAAPEVIHWRMQTFAPSEEFDWYKYMTKPFCEFVEDMSEGRLIIEPFLSGAIVGDREIAEALKVGTIESATSTAAYFYSEVPEAVFQSVIAGQFETEEDGFEFWFKFKDGAAAKIFENLYHEKGYHPLTQTRILMVTFTTKPITKVSDYEGMKIRVGVPSVIEHIKAMGASPVMLTIAETYLALQRGTADGAILDVMSLTSLKLHEVTPYLLGDPLYVCAQGTGVFVNLDAWESLPSDLQQIVEEASRKAVVEVHRPTINEKEQQMLERGAKELGVTVTSLTGEERQKWFDAAKPQWEPFRQLSPEAAELYDLWKEFYAEKGISR